MEVQAITKNVRMSGARVVALTLKSAMANAEDLKIHKPEYQGLQTERLRVKSAVAGTAGSRKSFIPKARGSAGAILKRSCHVKIVLSDE
jgi:large subunit ribosomal protein L22